MANSWYTRVKGFLAGTKARGSDVRFEYDAIEDAFDDMPAPHSGVPTTKGFADAIELESTLQVDGTTNLAGGLGANASGADTYKLTNMIDGTDFQDYATVAQVAAGGSPGDIPITSLGVGTATGDQVITINSGGTAVVGVDGITGLDPGSATTNQIISVNSGGTALEGTDQSDYGVTGFGVGSMTDGQLLTRSGSSLSGIDPSGYQLIETETISGTPTNVDFEWTSGTYPQHFFVFDSVVASSLAVNLYGRVKIGGSFQTGTVYRYHMLQLRDSVASASFFSTNSSFIWLARIGASATNHVGGHTFLYEGPRAGMTGQFVAYPTAIGLYHSLTGGIFDDTTGLAEGVRFYFDTGTFVSGKIYHYGLRTT